MQGMTITPGVAAISLPPVQILEEDMHQEARRRTGLQDFGAPSYQPGLRRLLGSFGPITASGWNVVRETVIRMLIRRLRTEAAWRQNPAYQNVRIGSPLVITGVPRTGTTALHKLLSIDPQFQGIEHWLCDSPMPRPPRETWESFPAYQQEQARLHDLHLMSPEMKLSHEVVVDEVDECLEILMQEFVSNGLACSLRVPAYDRWFREQDEGPSYTRLADALRLIGMHSPKPWLLKNPGHLATLDKLFGVFPDARVVVTSRDYPKAIASLCSVMVTVQSWCYDRPDPVAIGFRELEYWSEAFHKAARYRATHPENFYDVEHSQFHRDPVGTVQGVYDHFGLALTPETAAQMRRWLAANPAGKHGAHVYDLARFGLTEAQVNAAFTI